MTSMCTLLFLFIFVIRHCRADDIIVDVSINDTRLVTEPQNLWYRDSQYFSECYGYRYLNAAGQSVSLSFTGTRVTVNFYTHYHASVAQITLDGLNLTRVDLFNASSIFLPCQNPYTWTSDVLSMQPHTLNVTMLDPTPRSEIAPPWVPIVSFIYRYTPSNPSRTSPQIGAIAGPVVAVVAVLLLLVMATIIVRRRRRLRYTALSVVEPTFAGASEFHSRSLPYESFTQTGGHSELARPLALGHTVAGPPMTQVETEAAKDSEEGSQLSSPPSRQPVLLSPDTPTGSSSLKPTSANPSADKQLSSDQALAVQLLLQQNVPAATIASVIEGMAGGNSGAPAGFREQSLLPGTQAPPPSYGPGSRG